MTKDEKLITAEVLMAIATRMLSEAADPKSDLIDKMQATIDDLCKYNESLQQEIVGLRSQLEYFSPVKEGYIVVPIEPTQEMLEAIRQAFLLGWRDEMVWKKVLKAV